ncbi:EH1L1 protein, partial [Atlantisia rogersi]|nr:EH1L1 protein [Atlantisia rogersi]
PGPTGVVPPSQRLRDTGQFVGAELAALEQEQARVDARAETLERELRGLMSSGTGGGRGERGGVGHGDGTGSLPGAGGHRDRG